MEYTKKIRSAKYIENFNWLSNWIDDHLNVIINKYNMLSIIF